MYVIEPTEKTPIWTVEQWNDVPNRTFVEVAKVLDDAIEAAEIEELENR